jgi:hypothetical protein
MMRIIDLLLVIFTVPLITYSTSGCSRQEPVRPAGTGIVARPQANDEIDVAKLYDPTSMIEVKNFTDLPAGVQTLANGSFMKERYDNTPAKFLVGGVGKSSAIVTYEQFGYVPIFIAQSYVYSDSQWLTAKSWQLGAEIVRLRDVISSTSSTQ